MCAFRPSARCGGCSRSPKASPGRPTADRGRRRRMKFRSIFTLLAILVVVLGYAAGCATGGQPHMTGALDDLRSARPELQAANENKGGHRERALELVDQAIGEVQAGINFAASR